MKRFEEGILTKPRLSILMPAYNADSFIAEAIESILAQTFGDFELVIIDDGSTDGTADVIKFYKKTDSRIRFIRHHKNRGLAAVRNHLFGVAGCTTVAFMDADDISLPSRLKLQMNYLKRNTDIGVLAAWPEFFGAGPARVFRWPWTHEDILCSMIFNNIILNSSVMMDLTRLPALPLYRRAYAPAEDYGFWSWILMHGGRFSALQSPLVRYRIHQAQTQSIQAVALASCAKKIRKKWLDYIGLKTSADELVRHNLFCDGSLQGNDGSLLSWWKKLESAGLARGLPRTAWRHQIASARVGTGKLRHFRRTRNLVVAGVAVSWWEFRRRLSIAFRRLVF